jgi:hypothetical protein
VAACFLRRQREASLERAHACAGASPRAAQEDLYVIHSDGLLVRHRLQVEQVS